MALIAQKNTDWVLAPVGKWQAVCVDVRDEGLQPNPFPNKKTGLPQPDVHKISMHFQLNAPRDEQNRLPLISKWFTFSMWETAALPQFLASWFEVSQSDLPEDFDLDTLVGKNARIRVSHEPKKDKPGDRAVIAAIESWDGEIMAPDNFTRKPGKAGATETEQPAQAYAPNPEDSLPPTNRPVTPNPAPPMPTGEPVDVEAMKGNAATEHAKEQKKAEKALAKPELNITQMKVLKKNLVEEAAQYGVALEQCDYENFEEWKATAQAAIDAKGAEVFD